MVSLTLNFVSLGVVQFLFSTPAELCATSEAPRDPSSTDFVFSKPITYIPLSPVRPSEKRLHEGYISPTRKAMSIYKSRGY